MLQHPEDTNSLESISKGGMMINKVAGNTITLANFLLLLFGIGVFGLAFENSVTSFSFWFHIVVGAVLLFLAWAFWQVLHDFERLVDMYLSALQQLGYRDLDDYFERREERREK